MSSPVYTLTATQSIEAPWRSLPSVNLGQGALWRGPDGYILVERDGEPWLRMDIRHHEQAAPFAAAIQWRDWIVVGFDAEVYFTRVDDFSVHTLLVDRYFGHLHAQPEFLLVCSCTALIRIDEDLRERWRRELGVDGVLVHEVDGGVIIGELCWDPMEPWEPFRLDVDTGQRLK